MTTLPNFFVIGAAKSGTTSLYTYLREHPQVFMSPVKEPNFFSWGLSDGDLPHLGRGATVIRGFEAYGRLFSGVTDEVAVGEASVSYLNFPETAFRIRQHLPGAKLIAILRDPVERAYSSFLMRRRSGREPLADFRLALEAEQRGDAGQHPYLERGRYVSRLEQYLEHFPRHQVQVHLYDDLRADAAGVVRETFRFLGVDESFRADTSRRYEVGGSFRRPRVQALLEGIPRPLRVGLETLIPSAARTRVYWKLRAWNTSSAPPMPPGIRRRFVPIIRADVLALQDFIGRDLSSWLAADDPVSNHILKEGDELA